MWWRARSASRPSTRSRGTSSSEAVSSRTSPRAPSARWRSARATAWAWLDTSRPSCAARATRVFHLTVVELKSELVQEAPGLTVTLDPARLADCSKIVCTSTALLNDSLDALLAHGRGAREFVIIGPSAGCAPDPLFARGVTGIGGAWVADASSLLARAERGERWGDATRKFSLRRDAWPGLDEIIGRAARRTTGATP